LGPYFRADRPVSWIFHFVNVFGIGIGGPPILPCSPLYPATEDLAFFFCTKPDEPALSSPLRFPRSPPAHDETTEDGSSAFKESKTILGLGRHSLPFPAHMIDLGSLSEIFQCRAPSLNRILRSSFVALIDHPISPSVFFL
jgi:hypothetical protein